MDFLTTLYASFAFLFASLTLGLAAWVVDAPWRWPLALATVVGAALGLRTLMIALGRWLEEVADREVEAALASLPSSCRWLKGPLPLGIDHIIISPEKVTLLWQRHWQGRIEPRGHGAWLIEGRSEASPLPLIELAEVGVKAFLHQTSKVEGLLLLTSPLAQVSNGADLPLVTTHDLYNHLTEGVLLELSPSQQAQLNRQLQRLAGLVGQPNQVLLQGVQPSAEVGAAAGVT